MVTFIEATKDDAGNPKIYINADTIAWVEPNGDGSRVVFAAASAATGDNGLGNMQPRVFDQEVLVKEAPYMLIRTAQLTQGGT
jgi:hypothetical protein